MCYNSIAVATFSSHPTSLPIYLPTRNQKAFVPFRFSAGRISFCVGFVNTGAVPLVVDFFPPPFLVLELVPLRVIGD